MDNIEPTIDELTDRWLQPDEAAKYIGTTTETLLDRCRRGQIPESFYGRLGRRYRFKRSMLDKLLKTKADHV